MKQQIMKVFGLAAACSLMGGAVRAEDSRDMLAKGMTLGLNKTLVWDNLRNPEQRDALYEPATGLHSLSRNDLGLSLFFTRTGEMYYSVEEFFNLNDIRNLAKSFLEARFVATTDVLTPEDAGYDEEDDPVEYAAQEALYYAATEGRAITVAQSLRDGIGAITFQEHRVGAALSKEWSWGRWNASVRSWVGVAERNYWLSTDLRDGLAANMKLVAPSNDGTFNLSDFMSTCWGLGDTLVSLGYQLPTKNFYTVRAGLRAIVPTATKMRRKTAHAIAPLTGFEFLQFARARLNETLIEPKLGMGRWGVGLWSDATLTHEISASQQLSLSLYGSLDYLFTRGEERMLMQRADSARWGDDMVALAADFSAGSDADFRAYIHQYALPEPVPVVIAPGFIGVAGLAVHYCLYNTTFIAGYDWYTKSRERFVRFVSPVDFDTYATSYDADLGLQTQQKFYAGMSHTMRHRDVTLGGFHFNRFDITLGLKGSATLVAQRLGNDFGIGITCALQC